MSPHPDIEARLRSVLSAFDIDRYPHTPVEVDAIDLRTLLSDCAAQKARADAAEAETEKMRRAHARDEAHRRDIEPPAPIEDDDVLSPRDIIALHKSAQSLRGDRAERIRVDWLEVDEVIASRSEYVAMAESLMHQLQRADKAERECAELRTEVEASRRLLAKADEERAATDRIAEQRDAAQAKVERLRGAIDPDQLDAIADAVDRSVDINQHLYAIRIRSIADALRAALATEAREGK